MIKPSSQHKFQIDMVEFSGPVDRINIKFKGLSADNFWVLDKVKVITGNNSLQQQCFICNK